MGDRAWLTTRARADARPTATASTRLARWPQPGNTNANRVLRSPIGQPAALRRDVAPPVSGCHALDAVITASDKRHRLSRVGNRQLNAALHRIAVTQLRVHPPAQAYLARLQATGTSTREALRVLKRRLVRVVFNLLHADLNQAQLDPSTALLPAHEPAA